MLYDTTKPNRTARELCMRPVDYDEKLLPPPGDTGVEMKHDGIRALWRQATGVRTLEGGDFHAASHLVSGLAAIAEELGGDVVLDGEYMQPAGFEATLADFRRGRGTGIILLWDAVPGAVYDGRQPSLPLRERRALLETAIARVTAAKRHAGVGLSRMSIGYDAEGIELSAGVVWQDGYEGIVVKDLRSGYVRVRSDAWMRLKRTATADVRVKSIELREGTAILSAVVADYQGCDVRIGVGFSERERARPGDFRPGTLIEVKHLGETSRGSLKSATFLRIRGDRA